MHNIENRNATLQQLLSALSDKMTASVLNVPETVKAIEFWLRCVSDATEQPVQNVFNAIIGIFEKMHPKKNCLWLMGSPNSGKTTMMLYFASLYGKYNGFLVHIESR